MQSYFRTELCGVMHKLTEERITLNIIHHLENEGWKIACFDFPQSGTGKAIYADKDLCADCERIIPDIIAVKDKQILVFENKDRFYAPDFNKVNKMRTTKAYERDIQKIAKADHTYQILYGVGGPNIDKFIKPAILSQNHLDFIYTSDETKTMQLFPFYNKK